MLTGDLATIEQVKSCGYVPIKQKGDGAYGFIYEVSDVDGDLYAFKRNIKDNEEFGLNGLREIDILFRINHPYIIHGVKIMTPLNCKIKGVAIILPLADRSFFDLIKEHTITTVDKLPIIYKIASAINFLHSSNILHLDIKAANVVVRNVDNIVDKGYIASPYLIDFGLSMIVEDIAHGKEDTTTRVTIDHRAPELLATDKKIYNGAVDVWAFGIMILYSLSSKSIYHVDFENISEQEFKEVIINTFSNTRTIVKLLSGVNNEYRDNWTDLLVGMLQINPNDRFTMLQVYYHPVFDSVRIFEQDINGSLLYPEIKHDYAPDQRNIIKLLSHWAKQLFPKSKVELLFLGVDILNRVSSYYKDSSEKERTSLAGSCLWISSKLTDNITYDINTYCSKLSETMVIVPETILEQELSVLHYLSGILQVNELYTACKNVDSLRLSFDNIIMSKDSALYARADVNSWVLSLQDIVGESKSKDITIEEFIR